MSPLLQQAAAFAKRIEREKRALQVDFEWYPYDTLSNLWHIDRLLTGAHRGLIAPQGTGGRRERVLDFGSQDGELGFFLESLGYDVVAADHPAYNHNGMRGIRALKAALGSRVEIHEIDADRPFTLPHDGYDLVLFLGILYHLRNPFYVLEELARRATHLLLSTRVARRYPGGAAMPEGMAIAYLLRANELNQDDSNYFIFSEPALRVVLERAHWEVRDFLSLGAAASDPVRLDRDERAYCYARSRHSRLANLELLEGWHEPEDTGWRWTARRFRARLRAARTLTMRFYIAEESIRRLGRLTLAASANGVPLEAAVYETAGPATYVRTLDTAGEGAEVTVEFHLDGALEPDATDDRERGIIVAAIEAE
ncbi:MAG: hypothetical protein KGN36_17585 [Acidobacteriota bacterium]|nr:hypothetical protein [Acidobacteriota bacterium]